MKKYIAIVVSSLLTLSLVHTGLVYGEESAPSITGADQEVVIVYKNQAGKEAAIEQSVEVQHEFKTLPAVSATVSAGELQDLVQDPNIAYIERNVPFQVTDSSDFQVLGSTVNATEQSQWNYQAVQPNQMWDKGYNGSGIKVAVIDSGVAAHSELTIAGGVSTVDYTTSYADDNGHGTHVSGIIAAHSGDGAVTGTAPGVQLYGVKALGADGKGNLQDVLEGIDWAIQNRMDIINMSLGTEYDSQALHDMVDKAYNNGILVVCSAGNSGAGTDTVNYPAQYSSVIAVAAVDKNLNRGDFSSTGPKVEVSAPGVDIVSTYLNGKYAVASGTSQAAPHIAGILAILKQEHPSESIANLRTDLEDYIVDLGASGRDNLYGYGFVTFAPKVDKTAPAEVNGLTVSQATTNSLTLNWQNPVDKDFAKVNVYNDTGKLVTSVTKNVYQAEGLSPSTTYSFTLKTVDTTGNESTGKSISGQTLSPSTEATPVVESKPVIPTPTPVFAPTPAVTVPVVTTPAPTNLVAAVPSGGGGGGGGGGGIPRQPSTPSTTVTAPAVAPTPTPTQKATQQLNTAKTSGKAADWLKAKFDGKNVSDANFQKQLSQIKQTMGIKDLPSKAQLSPSIPVSISLQVALKNKQYKYIDSSSMTPDHVTVLNSNGEVVTNVNVSVKWNRIFITPTASGFAKNETYNIIIEKGIKAKPTAKSDQQVSSTTPLILQFTTR
ncbi:S8 family serine peptidase [Paenibacillus sp. PK4536]|uniref:S8 family serine peptidase n=1 Tax=Paenibacillus sp. PK4536 TaxID=3024576 RepID=UPI002358DBC3|nr:S8 family serine peptidase [Paenibacillus sp. PK4536]WIM40977.1 S8 family serine peptidase [Paenibacillus sp. PK4536]